MKIILTLILIFFFPQAFAHDSSQKNVDYRVLKELELQGASKAYIIAREDGHLLGQPFQVELRVQCHQEKVDVLKLKISDSFSVCDLSPESLKLNKAKTVIAMKAKMADLNTYYQDLEKGKASPEVKCGKATKIKKFSLKNLCQ